MHSLGRVQGQAVHVLPMRTVVATSQSWHAHVCVRAVLGCAERPLVTQAADGTPIAFHVGMYRCCYRSPVVGALLSSAGVCYRQLIGASRVQVWREARTWILATGSNCSARRAPRTVVPLSPRRSSSTRCVQTRVRVGALPIWAS